MEYSKVLSLPKVPEHLKKIPYEAEGPIQTKIEEIQEQMSSGKKLQFDKLIELQEGDSQKLGQPQISFLRQAMACTFYPELMKKKIYSEDVMKRAQSYLDYFLTIGVYPDAQGFDDCRASISKFLAKRDGYPSDPSIIFTTAGAIHGINSIIEFLIKDKQKDGIMLPIPSHPILNASIYSEGGKVVKYELDEENNWEIQISELKNRYDKAVQEGINVKGIIIINPNNPTGQILSEGKIKEIIQFCYDHRLAILADEIYQDNIYNPNQKFISFKKVLMDMGKTYSDSLQVISFHSISAGQYGECGLRGGFMELYNIEQGVLQNLFKLDGMYSTPNNSGQLALELMTNPPSKENNCLQETIDTFNKEIQSIFESQKKRASIVTDYLKQCKNIKTADINGSLYTFPQIEISSKAQKIAEEKGISPDTFYCFKCLEQTGIALKPGSEFGQKSGTHHFRISILQYDVAQMEEIMKKFKAFNDQFHEKYA